MAVLFSWLAATRAGCFVWRADLFVVEGPNCGVQVLLQDMDRDLSSVNFTEDIRVFEARLMPTSDASWLMSVETIFEDNREVDDPCLLSVVAGAGKYVTRVGDDGGAAAQAHLEFHAVQGGDNER